MTTLSPQTRALAPGPPEPPSVRFAAERAQDRAAVDALIDRAFGPGRFAKTAERLREGGAPDRGLSVCAWTGEVLAGAVRLWPACIGGSAAIFLGPIAVERSLRRHGLGAELVDHACRRAGQAGERVVILVGDMGFFGPLGFAPVPSGKVTLPGPVDPCRLLWRALEAGALEGAAGPLRTRIRLNDNSSAASHPATGVEASYAGTPARPAC